MDKRENIREGIARNLPQSKICFRCEETICDGNDKDICKVQLAIADKIMKTEHFQGVAIKVEDWLPTRSGMTCTILPLIKEE